MALALIGGSLDLVESKAVESITVCGTVRPLAEVLEERRIEVDRERVGESVVLMVEGGDALPLVPNTASRALFTDSRLRDRDTELVARRIVGLPHLEVVVFRVKEDGVYQVAEYVCDVCAIATRYDQACPCCQGKLRLGYRSGD